MTIYTLKQKYDDPIRGILNGKIFIIRRNSDLTMTFVDVDNRDELLTTKEVIVIKSDVDGLIKIYTVDGVYELIDIKTIIPTKSFNPADVKVISKIHDHKNINYGDGYDKTKFVFNKDLTEYEFVEYLKLNHYNIKPYEAWYYDYSKIEGAGNTWTYTMVHVYTD